jgi:hypothetical protein
VPTLAKKTSKNQLTLPADMIKGMEDVTYFSIERRDDTLVLKPVRLEDAETPLARFQRLFKQNGGDEQTIEDAVRWARTKR